MANVTPAEADRIVSHMNADHSSSLTHYLEFYGKVPSSQARLQPEITQFTSDKMIIKYGKGLGRKKWEWNWEKDDKEGRMLAGQARKRLEALHREARHGLGLSEVTIDSFELNHLTWAQLGFLSCLILFILVLPLKPFEEWLWFAVGPSQKIVGWLSPLLGNAHLKAQSYSNFYSWTKLRAVDKLNLSAVHLTHGMRVLVIATAKLLLVGPLLLIHMLECVVCLRPLMRRFNIEKTGVRWAYIIATVIGGFPVWQYVRRHGEALERKESDKKAEGKSH